MKCNSIAIISCWYGPFPWYFPYYLYSCSCNPTINFYLITDNHQPITKKSKNITIIFKTVSEIKTKAFEILGFRVSINYPYKLCDFRPAYGLIFSEIIKDYNFWGYGDIDVIYGNLRNFLTSKLLNNYDIFSFRPEYLTGCLTIIKNSEKMNLLFLQSRDYKKIFTKSQYFNFDECNFLFAALQAGESLNNIPCKIESMTHVVNKKVNQGLISAYFDFNLLEGTIGNLRWTQGKIIYKNQFEAILYHFLKFKDCYQNKKKLIQPNKNEVICISKKNIYKRKG